MGSAGIAVGLDASETQLCAADLRCSDANNVKFMCSFANNVDMPDQSCDAIASIQTLEYIEDVDACLAQLKQAETDGRFGFNTFPVLTRGTKT